MKKKILKVVLFLLASKGAWVSYYWIETNFKTYQPEFKLPMAQVWAHRGDHQEAEKNSIEAVQAAIDNGAHGVEVDVFFDQNSKKFVVSHDTPYKKRNGSYLYLEEVLLTVSDQIWIWVDFKNPKKRNLGEAIDRLEEIAEECDCKDKIFIESKRGKFLKYFTDADFKTIYWINNPTDMTPNPLLRFYYSHRIKYFAFQSKVTAISMDIAVYNDYAKENFGSLPIFLFTAKKADQIEKLLKDDHISVILSDVPIWRTGGE